jgi:hypothetical protein
LAAGCDDDGRDPAKEAAAIEAWYGWAMRTPDPRPEPCLEAAAADAIMDVVYAAEREAVDSYNLSADTQYRADMERFAAETADWPASEARQREAWQHNEEVKAAQLAERKARKRGPGPKYLRPEEFKATGRPREPPSPHHREPFDQWGASYMERRPGMPDAADRRSLRGRNESGVSWGPARPEPAAQERTIPALEAPRRPEPMREFAEPEPAEADGAADFETGPGDDPEIWAQGRTPATPEAEPEPALPDSLAAPIEPGEDIADPDPDPSEPPAVVAHVGAAIAEAFGMGPLVEAGLVVIEPDPVALAVRAPAEPARPISALSSAEAEAAGGHVRKRRPRRVKAGSAEAWLRDHPRAPEPEPDPEPAMGEPTPEEAADAAAIAAPAAPLAPAVSSAVPSPPDAPEGPPGAPPAAPGPSPRPEMAASWVGWRKRARFRVPPIRKGAAPRSPAPVYPGIPPYTAAPAASWRGWRTLPRFAPRSRCSARRHPTPGPSADARRLAA